MIHRDELLTLVSTRHNQLYQPTNQKINYTIKASVVGMWVLSTMVEGERLTTTGKLVGTINALGNEYGQWASQHTQQTGELIQWQANDPTLGTNSPNIHKIFKIPI